MKKLADLRKKIDVLDNELLELISKRVDLVNDIGIIKKQNKAKILDNQRRTEVLKKWLSHPVSKKISSKNIKTIYKTIHDISIEIEKNL